MLWNVDLRHEMDRIRKDMNTLFYNYGRSAESSTYPLVNIHDCDDDVTVTAELPGMTRDKINITFTDGALTISGKLENLIDTKNKSIIRQERSQGKFEKTVRIPYKIDQNKISATFNNGIVSIVLTKSEEAKPKTIIVETR